MSVRPRVFSRDGLDRLEAPSELPNLLGALLRVGQEGDAEGRVVSPEGVRRRQRRADLGLVTGPEIRIDLAISVGVGPAVETTLHDVVEFAGREVVAQQVAAVVGGIELAGPGPPVEAHGVAQPGGEDLLAAAVGPVAHDRRAPRVVLLATGSEVDLALQAQSDLASRGISTRVVSFPSWELFKEQSAEYRSSVLPEGVARLAIEAGASFGWTQWVGRDGAVIGIDRFGQSGSLADNFRDYGLTVAAIVAQAVEIAGADGAA